MNRLLLLGIPGGNPIGLNFDGGDQIVVSDNAALDVTHFRLEFWFMFDQTFTGGVGDVFLIHRDPPIQIFFNDTGNLRVAVNDGSSWREIGTTTDSWTGKQWYNISVNVAPEGDIHTGQLSLYVDGIRQSEGFIEAVGAAASTEDFTIGSKTDGSVGVTLHLDEMVFASDYREGTSFAAPTTQYESDEDTVFLFHMNENTGTVVDNAEGAAALDANFGAGGAAPAWAVGRF